MTHPAIIATSSLAQPWGGADPFLFMAHHLDHYPAGDGALAPQASLAGRQLGADFSGKDGWSMYHGGPVPGFPAHPHRGFETITIVTEGFVDHADSLGGRARYGMGDVQWLTAGRGILHAEMFPLLHTGRPNTLNLAQIWLNLPASNKMAAPHFAMFWADRIPELRHDDGTTVRVIAGNYGDAIALPPPPDSWAARPDSAMAIWLARLPAGARWRIPAAEAGLSRSLHVLIGDGIRIDTATLPARHTARLRSEFALEVENPGGAEVTLLLLQGRPIGEPVAAHGPFVMNTQEEIMRAFVDLRAHRFGRWPFATPDPTHGHDTARFAVHPDGTESRPAA